MFETFMLTETQIICDSLPFVASLYENVSLSQEPLETLFTIWAFRKQYSCNFWNILPIFIIIQHLSIQIVKYMAACPVGETLARCHNS